MDLGGGLTPFYCLWGDITDPQFLEENISQNERHVCAIYSFPPFVSTSTCVPISVHPFRNSHLL